MNAILGYNSGDVSTEVGHMRDNEFHPSPEDSALLDALQIEDQTLEAVGKQMDAIRQAFEVAAVKFAALRDLFRERAQVDPYSYPNIPFSTNGRYRFIRMGVGDAIVWILREAKGPLSQAAIVAELKKGGIEFEGTALSKAVNGALIRTRGIKKHILGYVFEPQVTGLGVPPDELPPEDDDMPPE
jgi:hypothetical protein